jgi:hypothetical protein
MVLTGKTLSPIGHRWDVGELANMHALCTVIAWPCRPALAECTGRPKRLMGQANNAGPRVETAIFPIFIFIYYFRKFKNA